MDIESLHRTVQSRRPVVIVLTREDFTQLEQWAREWILAHLKDRERLAASDEERQRGARFLGVPVVQTEFGQSFVVEDTPTGPLIHYLP